MVKRVLLCSGKIYFDLLEKQQSENREDVAIVRMEQLYPLPIEQLEKLKRGEIIEQKATVKEQRKTFKMEDSSDEETENFQEAREEADDETEKDKANDAEEDREETTGNEEAQTLASPEKFKANQRIEFKDNGKWERCCSWSSGQESGQI